MLKTLAENKIKTDLKKVEEEIENFITSLEDKLIEMAKEGYTWHRIREVDDNRLPVVIGRLEEKLKEKYPDLSYEIKNSMNSKSLYISWN